MYQTMRPLRGFRQGRCAEAVEDLLYQHIRYLEKQGETDHETVFIDGTKLGSAAGRYTFVWRKAVEKRLAKVKAMAPASTLSELEEYLAKMAGGIDFVHGSGKRKSKEQREREKLNGLCHRRKEYEQKLGIMGKWTQQRFQNRPGRHIHADEGRPHAQRAVQAGVQRTTRGEQRVYHGR